MRLLLVKLFETLFSREPLISPDLADEVTLTGAIGAWVYGAYVEIDADLNDKPAYLDYIMVHAITGDHQIQIAYGDAASETNICTLRVNSAGRYNVTSLKIPTDSRISARTASKVGTSQICVISLGYFEG